MENNVDKQIKKLQNKVMLNNEIFDLSRIIKFAGKEDKKAQICVVDGKEVYTPTQNFKILENFVLKNFNQPIVWTIFAEQNFYSTNYTKIEPMVLEQKNAFVCHKYAKNVKNADIKKHAQVVIDSGDAEANYKFAKDVEGADIKAHEKVILNSGDAVISALCVVNKVYTNIDPHLHNIKGNAEAEDILSIANDIWLTL